MGCKRKQPEPEQENGAPEWMVTFSDCMTLLLTFFVLLLSFSSFDEKGLLRLKQTFAKEFSSLSLTERERNKSAIADPVPTQYRDDLDKGSEKPTLKRGAEDNLKKDTEPVNFHDRKVFLISSDKIFWGKGTIISFRGRKTLFDMASFLKEMPSNRVVVGEHGQGNEKSSEDSGLQRAWAVIEYFTTKQGLDKEQFSLAADTLQKGYKDEQQDYPQEKVPRILEIVLLERSICN